MVSRRQALRLLGAGAATVASHGMFPRLHFREAFAQTAPSGHVVLVMYMSGGWDGGAILQPCSGAAYDACLAARPNLTKIPDPTSTAALNPNSAHGANPFQGANVIRRLTNDLGVHPQFEFVQRAFQNNEAIVFPTAGIAINNSGSHEEATRDVVQGLYDGNREFRSNGFIADILDKKYQGRTVGEFVALDMTSGESVLINPTVIRPIKAQGLENLGFDWPVEGDQDFTTDTIFLLNRDLQGTSAESAVARTARSIEETQARIDQALQGTTVNPAMSGGGIMGALRQAFIAIASLRAEGLEAITLSVGGFDTHNNQDRIYQTGGQLMGLSSTLRQISDAYTLFEQNLRRAGLHQHVTTLIVSEFGRTARENGSTGTDHGRGNSYIMLGGSVAGGQVVGSGVQPGDYTRGDNSLPVTVPLPAIVSQIAEKMGVPRAQIYPPEVLNALPGLPNLFRA